MMVGLLLEARESKQFMDILFRDYVTQNLPGNSGLPELIKYLFNKNTKIDEYFKIEQKLFLGLSK